MLGILQILLHRVYKLMYHRSLNTNSNIMPYNLLITFITTSIYKFYVVKFIIRLEFSWGLYSVFENTQDRRYVSAIDCFFVPSALLTSSCCLPWMSILPQMQVIIRVCVREREREEWWKMLTKNKNMITYILKNKQIVTLLTRMC